MKRPIRRILLCTLLGAVTTVAVAWGLSLLAWAGKLDHNYFMPAADESINIDGAELSVARWEIGAVLGGDEVLIPGFKIAALELWNWDLGSEGTPSHRAELVNGMTRIAPSWAENSIRSNYRQRPKGWWGVVYTVTGWPCQALGGVLPDLSAATIGQGLSAWTVLRTRRTTADTDRLPAAILPLRPIWPGFAINTAFYGAIWFGAFFGVGATRRAIRRRRDRCVMCGYDLRANETGVCPECGAAA